jgi:hypothetical protein
MHRDYVPSSSGTSSKSSGEMRGLRNLQEEAQDRAASREENARLAARQIKALFAEWYGRKRASKKS